MEKSFYNCVMIWTELVTMVAHHYTFASSLWTRIFTFHQSQDTLMQDNATSHVSASTQFFLERHDVSLLEWPAGAPACYPFEN